MPKRWPRWASRHERGTGTGRSRCASGADPRPARPPRCPRRGTAGTGNAHCVSRVRGSGPPARRRPADAGTRRRRARGPAGSRAPRTRRLAGALQLRRGAGDVRRGHRRGGAAGAGAARTPGRRRDPQQPCQCAARGRRREARPGGISGRAGGRARTPRRTAQPRRGRTVAGAARRCRNAPARGAGGTAASAGMAAAGSRAAPAAAQFPYQAGLMADEEHHYAEAARYYRRALQLDPGLRIAEGQLLFVLRRMYDWAGAAPLAARLRARVADGSGEVDPFAFLAEDAGAAEQLACARARAMRVMRDVKPLAERLRFRHAPRAAGKPLRAGFLSAGFGARAGVPHATALLTVAMFEELGKLDDIELHLIATTPDEGSAIRQRLRHAGHAFHEAAALPVAELAQRVHDTRIDILVDVDGWCAGGVPEVLALRPAPVQVSWLAYPGTSGAAFIDYLIADRALIPEPLQAFYSEAIAYLPRCYQTSDPARTIGPSPPRAAFGLPGDAVVFASFNNPWKLNAASFARMCAVLREVPGSVLWLLTAGRDADARLREAARAHGVDPQRLVFSPSLPHLQHLARYRLADLFLDTNPYNAHTTASDAIWAGCPVLTRPGETFASRVAASLNHHLGMPELIARDDDAFVATAARYGNDRSVLAALHERLAKQRETSGLFDMRAYARDFAALLCEMAERQRKGLPPQTIALHTGARQPE